MIHCLYVLTHQTTFRYENRKIIAIGSTIVINSKYKQYSTSHPIPHKYLCYYELKNYNCYRLDNEIKKHFESYRALHPEPNGGIVFYYDDLELGMLEQYMIDNKIKFVRHSQPFDFEDDNNMLDSNTETLFDNYCREKYNETGIFNGQQYKQKFIQYITNR
jgi:hypothetical protein